MSRFDELPADQQAVLSLLLRRGRSYAQVAAALAIDESAVRGRAQQALVTLAGARRAGLPVEQFEQIGDYLLGQLAEGERIETLALLMDTGAGREWARTIAGELGSVAVVALPAVPDDPAERALPAVPDEPPAPLRPHDAPLREARPAERERRPRKEAGRGRLVLLGAAMLAIAAIAVLVFDSGGTSSPVPGPIPAGAATQTATTPSSNSGILTELALKPTAAGSKAAGAIAIVQNGSTLQIAFSAAHMPAPGSSHYVLWLYDSQTHFEALGAVQTVSASGSIGPLAVALPSDASSYHGVALTLETSNAPAGPGPVLLSGTSSAPL
jgi:hypothetical protein